MNLKPTKNRHWSTLTVSSTGQPISDYYFSTLIGLTWGGTQKAEEFWGPSNKADWFCQRQQVQTLTLHTPNLLLNMPRPQGAAIHTRKGHHSYPWLGDTWGETHTQYEVKSLHEYRNLTLTSAVIFRFPIKLFSRISNTCHSIIQLAIYEVHLQPSLMAISSEICPTDFN